MATAPKFEDLQNFSKQQLEAFTAASTAWTKGMQELAAEFDRLCQEGLHGQLRRLREASRRAQC